MTLEPAALSARLSTLSLEAAPPARGGGLGDVVFAVLRKALRDGVFQPGDRLREEEIAEHFQVSRTPVRDALRRLLERRLLEASGGRGLMVRRLDRAEVFELYQMREILEGTAARLAAENVTGAEIALLRELHAAFEAAHTPQEWARINKQFHDVIVGAVRNRYYHSPLEELQDFLALLGGTTFAVDGRAHMAVEEHRRIVDAIAARDPDAAEHAAREHIRGALATRVRMLAATS